MTEIFVVNAIPITPAMLEIARRVIWFEPPEKAIRDPVQFKAYAMTYAVHEDMRVIRQFVSDDDLRDALDHAPPGIIDPRSWGLLELQNGPVSRAATAPAEVRAQLMTAGAAALSAPVMSQSNPCSSCAGVGGQPRITRSTGMTFETAPTHA